MGPMELRRTFNEDAERYDRARPRYPQRMFDDLAAATDGRRVLEIGCGTGQATVPLAERGYRVVAVELGAELADVARRNLAPFADVEVVTAAFEEWPLPDEPFDVVLSATAFHWIDPAVRLVKTARALKPGGLLAIVSTHHVAGGTEAFFAEVQDCYERFDPATEKGLRLPAAATVPGDSTEMGGPARTLWYEWDVTYSTEAYLDVLLTYSGTRALPTTQRDRLLECIAGLIDRRYGGAVVKRYLTELRLAATPEPAGRPS